MAWFADSATSRMDASHWLKWRKILHRSFSRWRNVSMVDAAGCCWYCPTGARCALAEVVEIDRVCLFFRFVLRVMTYLMLLFVGEAEGKGVCVTFKSPNRNGDGNGEGAGEEDCGVAKVSAPGGVLRIGVGVEHSCTRKRWFSCFNCLTISRRCLLKARELKEDEDEDEGAEAAEPPRRGEGATAEAARPAPRNCCRLFFHCGFTLCRSAYPSIFRVGEIRLAPDGDDVGGGDESPPSAALAALAALAAFAYCCPRCPAAASIRLPAEIPSAAQSRSAAAIWRSRLDIFVIRCGRPRGILQGGGVQLFIYRYT